MSYEGYEQKLCANGHLYTVDCWDRETGCGCGASAAWSNSVDDTNCDNWGWIDMKRFEIQPEQVCVCECGHAHKGAPAVYRTPSEEEVRLSRTYRGEKYQYFYEWNNQPVEQ